MQVRKGLILEPVINSRVDDRLEELNKINELNMKGGENMMRKSDDEAKFRVCRKKHRKISKASRRKNKRIRRS